METNEEEQYQDEMDKYQGKSLEELLSLIKCAMVCANGIHTILYESCFWEGDYPTDLHNMHEKMKKLETQMETHLKEIETDYKDYIPHIGEQIEKVVERWSDAACVEPYEEEYKIDIELLFFEREIGDEKHDVQCNLNCYYYLERSIAFLLNEPYIPFSEREEDYQPYKENEENYEAFEVARK